MESLSSSLPSKPSTEPTAAPPTTNEPFVHLRQNFSPDYPPTSHWRFGLQTMCYPDDPPVILVDMDNTLVDWESQFERLMQTHHPQIPIVPPSDRTEFKIELNYNDEYRDSILHLTSLDEFWLSMDPTEGALQALDEMVNIGLIVFIVTTPDAKHTARSAFEKISWIERHLGSEWKAKTVLAHDKTLIKGDILIDDRPSASVGLLRPSWTHMLYAQPYNKSSEICPRLERWGEWGPTIYTVLVNREQEKMKMAALWDIKGEEAVEKKLSDISDGVRHQSRHHNARLFSSDSESGSIIETTNRVTAKRVCCGSSRFGSPFDGPGQKELMVVHNSN